MPVCRLQSTHFIASDVSGRNLDVSGMSTGSHVLGDAGSRAEKYKNLRADRQPRHVETLVSSNSVEVIVEVDV
jgi:hypothetical protein